MKMERSAEMRTCGNFFHFQSSRPWRFGIFNGGVNFPEALCPRVVGWCSIFESVRAEGANNFRRVFIFVALLLGAPVCVPQKSIRT
jgi:hypothetical protein